MVSRYTEYVYALTRSDGAVKIGRSNDPYKRRLQIARDQSLPCTLAGYVQAEHAQEAELHRLLASWRIKGEWYRNIGPVRRFVSMLPNRDTDATNPTFTRQLRKQA